METNMTNLNYSKLKSVEKEKVSGETEGCC